MACVSGEENRRESIEEAIPTSTTKGGADGQGFDGLREDEHNVDAII
jgi:hypothetical protein